ncbi:MAG: hypothetical protein ACI3Y0_09380 [Prevotella sp.]
MQISTDNTPSIRRGLGVSPLFLRSSFALPSLFLRSSFARTLMKKRMHSGATAKE